MLPRQLLHRHRRGPLGVSRAVTCNQPCGQLKTSLVKLVCPSSLLETQSRLLSSPFFFLSSDIATSRTDEIRRPCSIPIQLRAQLAPHRPCASAGTARAIPVHHNQPGTIIPFATVRGATELASAVAGLLRLLSLISLSCFVLTSVP